MLPPDVRFLRLKCTKIDFGWGSAPDPAEGAYSAPPDSLAGLLLRREKRREGKATAGEGRGRERKGCVMAVGGMDARPRWIRPRRGKHTQLCKRSAAHGLAASGK